MAKRESYTQPWLAGTRFGAFNKGETYFASQYYVVIRDLTATGRLEVEVLHVWPDRSTSPASKDWPTELVPYERAVALVADGVWVLKEPSA